MSLLVLSPHLTLNLPCLLFHCKRQITIAKNLISNETSPMMMIFNERRKKKLSLLAKNSMVCTSSQEVELLQKLIKSSLRREINSSLPPEERIRINSFSSTLFLILKSSSIQDLPKMFSLCVMLLLLLFAVGMSLISLQEWNDPQ